MMNRCGMCVNFKIKKQDERTSMAYCRLMNDYRNSKHDCCQYFDEKEVYYSLDECERLVNVNED